MGSVVDQNQKKRSLLVGDWTQLLQSAVREVFDIMLDTQLGRMESARPQGNSGPGLTAMVGLAGQVSGVLSLRCSHRAAASIASRMLKLEPRQAEGSAPDAIGEICNMIAGNFKTKIAGLSEECMLSVPTIVTGSDYNLRLLADVECVEITLEFEDGTLNVSLEMRI